MPSQRHLKIQNPVLNQIKNQNDELMKEISQIKETLELLKQEMVIVSHEESRPSPLLTGLTQSQTAVEKGWFW